MPPLGASTSKPPLQYLKPWPPFDYFFVAGGLVRPPIESEGANMRELAKARLVPRAVKSSRA